MKGQKLIRPLNIRHPKNDDRLVERRKKEAAEEAGPKWVYSGKCQSDRVVTFLEGITNFETCLQISVVVSSPLLLYRNMPWQCDPNGES